MDGQPASAAVPGTPGAPTVTVGDRRRAHGHGRRSRSRRTTAATASRATAPVASSSNGGLSASRQGFNTPITVTALTSSKTYTCTVAAINKIAIGPASAPSAPVITLPRPPDAPKITKMTPGLAQSDRVVRGRDHRRRADHQLPRHVHVGVRHAIASGFLVPDHDRVRGRRRAIHVQRRRRESRRLEPFIGELRARSSSLPIKPGAPTITAVIAGCAPSRSQFAKPVNDGGVRVTGYRATCVSSNGGVTGIHQSFKSPVTVAGFRRRRRIRARSPR